MKFSTKALLTLLSLAGFFEGVHQIRLREAPTWGNEGNARLASCPPEMEGGTYGRGFGQPSKYGEHYGEQVGQWEGLVRGAVDEFVRSVGTDCLPEDIEAWKEQMVADILAIIKIESRGNPEAKGAVGEEGLMQLTPRFFGQYTPSGRNLWAADVNIGIGGASHIIKWLTIYWSWGENADWDRISELAAVRHNRPGAQSADERPEYKRRFVTSKVGGDW